MSQTNTNVGLFSPSLPKGGGSIKGMEGSVTAPGSDGMARFNVPLPVTPGRTITPDVNLSYSSGNGNGPFGMGWHMGFMSIRRRTNTGIPSYKSGDHFIGPDGEVLVPESDENGQVITRQTDTTAQGISLGEPFIVTRYFPRIESNFNLIEYWEAKEDSHTSPFWLIHSADGILHCFGKTVQAKIASPDDPTKIAEWLLEESVSPFGEHVYYQYKEEDNIGINLKQDTHQYGGNRYLKTIRYGNKVAYHSLYLWNGEIPMDSQWLYFVMLDYGENDTSVNGSPQYTYQGEWLARADCFSRYEYGFETRTCRLCRQVLMFHNFTELNEEPTLIWKMQFEYDENPAVSMLTAVQQLAYETDGKPLSMPPLEFDYTPFEIHQPIDWQPFLPAPELNNGEQYQIVDLYGEGIPGLLYRDKSHWHYRSPVRSDTLDGITYESWKSLPQIPVNVQNGMLLDMNGDGYLEWLIAQSGVIGSYTMNPDKTWSNFVPFKALPTEFFHPKAQLSNVTGSGLPDLVMIGPKSVRFYAGEESGFKRSREVWQKAGITLPIEGLNEKELIAFSDMLGSGQSHLVRIRHDGVTCWPNMGQGIFGEPLVLPGFTINERDFDPKRVYLADLDGSGTSDVIYASHDALHIYQNLSGNSFADPVQIPLPAGVHFDNLCRLQPADISGRGISNLVLNVPYISPRSWYLDLCSIKPYLLKSTSNNLGASNEFFYRSSAQYWLDEKQSDSSVVCTLPFPINVISCIQTLDEISGSTKIQEYTYRNGVYDRMEKEFAGFGYIVTKVEERDYEGSISKNTQPILTRSWYHTGQQEDDTRTFTQSWKGDPIAFHLKPSRFTTFDLNVTKDVPLDSLNERQEYWLYRSLKGMPLRTEIFRGDMLESSPYLVESYRYQVRLVQSTDSECVVLPLQLEQLTYNYEQISSDPQCTQQIQQFFDEYGSSTQSVTIHYPRREQPNENPYPDTLPDTSWSSSYDSQQMLLRFTRQREKAYHLTNSENWRLGIPHQNRLDAFVYPAESVPNEGISTELLGDDGTLQTPAQEQAYGGQTEVIYVGDNKPDLRALIYYTRSAVLDEVCLQAYEGILSDEQLNLLLTSAGYKQSTRILGFEDEPDVLVAEQGFTRYTNKEGFYRMVGQQASMLTGEQVLSWDDNWCVVISAEDAVKNKTQIAYDYRFLQANQIIDANNNVSQVQLDALGRVIYSRIWGTEKGEDVGFNPALQFSSPETIDQALTLVPPLPVGSCYVYDTNSWMGKISFEQLSELVSDGTELWNFLIANRFITLDGRIRTRGRFQKDLSQLSQTVSNIFKGAIRNPSHTLILKADRYPDDPAQQIQTTIIFSDGFGRMLQSSQKAEPKGDILDNAKENLIKSENKTRWIISERADYDGKGTVIRNFQPIYLHDWQYVNNESIHSQMYATNYYYDALSRQIRVVNAKGYEQRNAFYPWFTVNEDENDTWNNGGMEE
ncbi:MULTISPECIES: SpvB/TcaC N-terminal domain-containing protein [Bacillus cereus group]|uniref:Toxin n=1 Tax=Bacillus thuringiensis serovar toumanoffi TaxID=180862 RepID=A0ABD5I8B1_BACTU|nr:SpvB/TcaC N-terminal domain-containing protein [Bacillus thuringiensis]MCU5279430.1 toxin [Bacillus cereus]AMR88552.1 toxin [Bacillus thuringiensis]EEM92892.1 Insecticidal toxin complex protein TcaC (Toxin complex protein) [Bacillus thuringiensis IBL 200]KIP23481.1 virulence plasmid 65kDa B family protein [Bacillus thuringiensis serovar morrisoni]MBG9640451.1 toxin [Bacillus thuringiensis]